VKSFCKSKLKELFRNWRWKLWKEIR